MRREIDIKEISDGNLYELNDLVKADCGDCKGCSDCCRGMGESIVLDPYDMNRLIQGLNITFEQLLADKIELNVYDGMILPCLKMNNEKESCAFLSDEGRCSIHSIRPGICRLFPLGRVYEGDSFQYFLQIHECKNQNRTKVKVKKWIDIPDIKENTEFILSWHNFVTKIQDQMMRRGNEEEFKKVNLFLLQHFYMEPYHAEESFYTQFQERLKKAESILKQLLQE
jgi:Fe-S-cluster containining protein